MTNTDLNTVDLQNHHLPAPRCTARARPLRRVVSPPPAATYDERLRLWTECFEEWLASRRAESTRQAYRAAVTEFVIGLDVPIWLSTPQHVERWLAGLRDRKRCEATVSLRLAALSSFFRYAMQVKTCTKPDGSLRGLADFNPAAAVRRPEVEPYGRAWFLSKDQRVALLRAIPRDTVRGKLHYALILTYLTTGRRNSEIRRLRWCDIEVRGEQIFYTFNNKGKRDQRYEFPRHAWAAIVDYLTAAGRYGSLKQTDYLFTAISDRACRLTSTKPDWRPGTTPLSVREVVRIVAMYGRRIGLKHLKVHWLRHTYAEMNREAGVDVMKLQQRLGHSKITTTMIYLHANVGHVIDEDYDAMAAQLGLDE